MTIRKFQRKPESRSADVQIAARYEPGGDLGDLLSVARETGPEAEVTEVTFRSGKRVLLAWYMHYPDHHPALPKYVEVEPGDYLAYSRYNDLLYDADEADWRQFYDEVTPD